MILPRYTKLGDDLDTLIRCFDTDPAITAGQRGFWSPEGKKRAITHGMFGFDHEKALAFEDGTPIGSVRKNTARRFWDYASGHVFPPVDDMARLCFFMHRDIYQTLVILLKAEWEFFFAHDVNGWRANSGTSLTDILFEWNEYVLREALARFKPRHDLYALLEGLALHRQAAPGGSRPFLEGYTPAAFADLVHEMIMGPYHFHSAESPEIARFSAQSRRELTLLVEGTDEEKRLYPLEKARWVSLRRELEDLYLLIENQRLMNAHTHRKWLVLFGNEEVALREAALAYERSDIRYNLKTTNPEWGREDIERCVEEEEARRQLELSRLKMDTALAPRLAREVPEETGARQDGTEPAQYFKECKKVLRQIRRLIHPDRLMHHPSFRDLTDNQKERLTGILLSALEVRPEELGYPEGYPLHDMRSLEGLRNALSRIEEILGNPGIDMDERLTIRGENLPEKLKWLKRENRIIEDEILSGKAELQALFENEETAGKRAVLNDPASHEKVREDFRTHTAELRRDAGKLQEAFDRLFAS